MPRTPEEVFQHPVQALGAGDRDEIVADYSEDAVFISPSGVLRGPEGIRAADAAATRVEDGIDTFVFRDGLIQVQTIRYTLERKS